ncbi:hypothetical protein [Rubritalea tangerina]
MGAITRVIAMQKFLKLSVAALILSMLNSCNAPLVKNTLSLPGRTVRGAAHAVGMGGVAGM